MESSLLFEKFHGNGNDFLFFEKRTLILFNSLSAIREFAIKTCNRNLGPGADGLVFYDSEQHQLLIVNSDGSFAATCGNALRCYGLKLLREELWQGESFISITRLIPSQSLEKAQLDKSESFLFLKHDPIAILMAGERKKQKINVAMGWERQVEVFDVPENRWGFSHSLMVSVQLSNPHLVFVSPHFSSFSLEEYKKFGQWAQNEVTKIFPERIPVSNIGMVNLQEGGRSTEFNLVVYERGAGLTLCCGSGAVAAMVALEALHLIESGCEKVSFNLLGGSVDMMIYRPDREEAAFQSFCLGQQRILAGPAQFVYKGILEWI